MAHVVAISKFTIREDGQSKTYRPGNVVKEASADFALENGYAEKRQPSPVGGKNRKPPVKGEIRLGAPENKDAAQIPNNKQLKTSKQVDGSPVLGSEDEQK